ncbi:MAG TPA: EI24 domain-containing protein [Acetobacteraceae bacterium]|jgi:uncharacterized protein involved in cysteine biosynthesis|nr:EI24 domain-containing protein [Acetobacteraceae bacterium]
MLRPILLAFRQIRDPAFLGPLLKGAGLAALAALALVGGAVWAASWLAGGTGWVATLAEAAGLVAALAAAWLLFLPLLLAIAGIFTDEVAAAVERRHYPGLPPARGAGVLAQGAAGLALGLRFGGLALLLLPLGILLPGIGAAIIWAVAAIGLGEGLFEGVAQRRMGVAEARALRRRRRLRIWALGAVLAAMALVSPLNLLVPVIGTAAMTHLLHEGLRPR